MSDGIEYLLGRRELSDGEVTTVYAVRHPSRSTRVRVAHFPRTAAVLPPSCIAGTF